MRTTHATFQTIDRRTTVVRANLPSRGRVTMTLPVNPLSLHRWFHSPRATRMPPRQQFHHCKEHQLAFLQELHATDV